MKGPGGPLYNDRQMLAYHDYCFLLTPDGQPLVNTSCRDSDAKLFRTRMADLHNLGVGGIMTEWGALANGTGRDAAEAYHVCGNADAYLQSWIYWSLKSYHDITTQVSCWLHIGCICSAKRERRVRNYDS